MPNLKHILLLIGLILGLNVVHAQEVWSLEKCINHALENNIQVKQSELNVDLAEIDLLQSKMNQLPSLSAGAAHNYTWGRSIDLFTDVFVNQETQTTNMFVSGSFTIFGGLQTRNSIVQNRQSLAASEMNLSSLKNDISLAVATSYLQILFNLELLEMAKRQLEIIQLQSQRTKQLVEAGQLPRGNLFDIDAQAANEELNLVNAENQLTMSYLSLTQLLQLEGLEAKEFAVETPYYDMVDDSKVPEEVELIVNQAMGGMPNIKSAEIGLLSSKKATAIARGGRSPVLSLRGDLRSNVRKFYFPFEPIPFGTQVGDNFGSGMSLNLSIPIFNNGSVNNGISRAKIGELNAEYNLKAAKNQLYQDVQNAHADAMAALKRFKAAEKASKSAGEAFKYAEVRYQQKMINSVEYVDTKTRLSNAESEMLQAKYDYIFRLKILDFYQGKPLTL